MPASKTLPAADREITLKLSETDYHRICMAVRQKADELARNAKARRYAGPGNKSVRAMIRQNSRNYHALAAAIWGKAETSAETTLLVDHGSEYNGETYISCAVHMRQSMSDRTGRFEGESLEELEAFIREHRNCQRYVPENDDVPEYDGQDDD